MRLPDLRSEREADGAPAPLGLFVPGLYLRRYRLIGATVLVAVLLAAAFAVLRPPSYTARAGLLLGTRLGQSGAVAAEGESRALALRIQQLSAQKARLRAESTDANEIAFPPELSGPTADPALRGILEGERDLFAARRRALDESVEKFRQERSLAEQRTGTLGRQLKLAARQQELIEGEVADLRSLVERKLVPAPRLGDLQRTAASIASHRVEIESEIVRSQQGQNQADQRMAEVRNQRRSEVLAEQQKIDAELRELATRRETFRAVATSTMADQRFDPAMLANQAEILTSDELVRKVAERLKLDQDPAFGQAGVTSGRSGTPLEIAAATLQANLSAVRVGAGSRLDVAFRWRDPHQSALIANTVAEVFIEGQRNGTPGESGAQPGAAPLQQSGATLVRAAEPPLRRDGPGPLSISAAGAVLGLMLGLALAAISELIGSRHRSSERPGAYEPSSSPHPRRSVVAPPDHPADTEAQEPVTATGRPVFRFTRPR